MQEKIKEILSGLLAGVDLNSKTLADDGIINSLVVVNLVTELDLEFDVEIPFDSLVNENFNSIEAIEALVKSLQK